VGSESRAQRIEKQEREPQMDFSFSEEQTMLRDLAREILAAEVTPELLKQIEAGGDWFHAGLWTELAGANLLGVAVPEEHGGMGFGLIELCVLLEEVGRAVAPLPVLPSLVLGGLPISSDGSDEQKARWLSPLARGEIVLTAALDDAGSEDVLAPATRARRDGVDFVLDGAKRFVPSAGRAARILVPAAGEDGLSILLVDPAAPGVELSPRRMTHRETVFDLRLTGVRVPATERLGGRGADAAPMLRRLVDGALVATCALQLGVSGRALEMTAGYAREREQFGQAIGAFQAVQHRLADGYIDLESMRWTLWQAAFRIAEGLDASREAMVAKFWAAEGGSRIASTAQHVHAGHGVDLDYGIHRHFIWTKALELSLGSATPQLVRLGRDMARRGPQESL